jgi:tetratricopeptide (TPR) repeat protein
MSHIIAIMDSAVHCHRHGQIARAEELFKRIIAHHPFHAQALHYRALICFQRREFDQALNWVKQAITADDTVALFHNTHGVLLEHKGEFDQAVEAQQRAVVLQPDYTEAYINMAVSLQAKGDHEQAKAVCEKVLVLDPGNAKVYNVLAFCQQTLKQYSDAMRNYQHSLMLNPQQVEVYNHMGFIMAQQQHYLEAITFHRRALDRDPEYADAHNNIGIALKASGDTQQAIVHYQKAIALEPRFAEAYCNLANAQSALGQTESAMENWKKAIDANPHYAQAYNQLGVMYNDQGHTDQAIKHYIKAMTLSPQQADSYNNLAIVRKTQGQHDEAIELYHTSITLEPDNPEAYYNLAGLYKEQGRCQEAVGHYVQAIWIDPTYAQAHWNLALTYLLQGEFEKGWEQYQWRHQALENTSLYPHAYDRPRWDGSAFTGKRLLIYTEQGLGDAIQFVRYLPLVKALGGTVLFETWQPLMRLFQSVHGIDELIQVTTDPISEDRFDLHISIMDLPRLFETNSTSVPRKTPYLTPDVSDTAFWQQRLLGACRRIPSSARERAIFSSGKDGEAGDVGFIVDTARCSQAEKGPLEARSSSPSGSLEPDYKIGIVWAGSPNHGNDHLRSCGLHHFSTIARLKGVKLYSLQQGAAAEQIETCGDSLPITPLGHQFNDLMDTACAIQQLDLIISVDTALAHLAGALGKPVWTLLPTAPDWRWMLHRSDSPWYPTMRLFRQSHAGQWDAVFTDIAHSLQSQLSTPLEPSTGAGCP